MRYEKPIIMSFNFLITNIQITFPETSNVFTPLVYKYNGQYQMTFGIVCGTQSPPLDNPIKIYKNGAPPPSGNSFVTIAAATGQYQIFFIDGHTKGSFSIVLQSLTSSEPYPDNCHTLAAGLTGSQNFILSIDMTSQNMATGGISLSPVSG